MYELALLLLQYLVDPAFARLDWMSKLIVRVDEHTSR